MEKKNSDSDPLCLGPRYNTFLESPVCEGQNAAGPIRVGRTVQEKRQSKRKYVFGVIRAYSPVLHEIFCMPKLPLCPNYPGSLYTTKVPHLSTQARRLRVIVVILCVLAIIFISEMHGTCRYCDFRQLKRVS